MPGPDSQQPNWSKLSCTLPFCKRYKFVFVTATLHQSVAGWGARDCFPKVNIIHVDPTYIRTRDDKRKESTALEIKCLDLGRVSRAGLQALLWQHGSYLFLESLFFLQYLL